MFTRLSYTWNLMAASWAALKRDKILVLFPLFSAVPANAQRVNADIIIGGGPIAGRVIIGDHERDGYRGRPRPIRGIDWIRASDYRRDDWWRRFERESRPVVVYWDRNDDCYYLDRFRPGLEEIRVYERDGRFYRLEEDGYGGGYDNRYDDRYDNRYDSRYDHRYDSRYDSRYDHRYDNHHYDNRRWDDRRGHRKGDEDDRDDRRDNRGDHRGN